MNFSLIICTYMCPESLLTLLKSVESQVLYPNEIIIVDGSINNLTKQEINKYPFKNLKYFEVTPNDRGLTKQRNFGISKVSNAIDIVCFLDDDIILTKTYFKNLIETYNEFPEAGGVGGYIINEVSWRKLTSKINLSIWDVTPPYPVSTGTARRSARCCFESSRSSVVPAAEFDCCEV